MSIRLAFQKWGALGDSIRGRFSPYTQQARAMCMGIQGGRVGVAYDVINRAGPMGLAGQGR
jgi:hypothetical protein